MNVCEQASELQHHLGNFRSEQIALVPTMGCLHEGHIALIRQAKRLADVVVVSIYVNPLQFGKNEDFSAYPQTWQQDLAICEAEGVDFVFHPDSLYHDNLCPASGLQVGLHVNSLSQHLCGLSRPGHFDGVVTVVNILFNIVQPNIAVFGEKDFQQLSIIQRMTTDLYMPIQIIAGETVREADGLAKSSRNVYLNEQQRIQAAQIPATLHFMQQTAKETDDYEQTMLAGQQHLQKHAISPEYLQICHKQSLEPVNTLENKEYLRIFIAAPIGSARLIDNMPLIAPSSDIEDDLLVETKEPTCN